MAPNRPAARQRMVGGRPPLFEKPRTPTRRNPPAPPRPHGNPERLPILVSTTRRAQRKSARLPPSGPGSGPVHPPGPGTTRFSDTHPDHTRYPTTHPPPAVYIRHSPEPPTCGIEVAVTRVDAINTSHNSAVSPRQTPPQRAKTALTGP